MRKLINFILIVVLLPAYIGCNSDDMPAPTPGDVNLIAPLKDQSCEEGINSEDNRSRIFFEWEPGENAQSYDLVVTDLETGENFITYEEIYDTRKELELIHNKAYSWKVISHHSESDVAGTSETWNFYFVGEPKDNYAPFPANIIAPEFGKSVDLSNNEISLVWEASDPDGDSLKYSVFLDEVDGMQEPREELKNLDVTDVNVQVESGKTYYWRVKSSDGISSSYSQIYQFSTN